MKRLEGKVSLITGAAQGIGLATALKFAQEGSTVIVCDVKQAGVDDAVRQCEALGVQALGFVMDVTQRDMVDAVVAQVQQRLGRIDVLVNNAGIIGGVEYARNLASRAAQLEELQQGGAITTPTNATASMTDAQWRAMLSTHLDGTFYCTRAVLSGMQSRRCGAIVNMSSIMGLSGGNGVPHYAAAKAGIIAFTRAVAQEVAPFGIRVNAVAPGFIDTAMRSQLPPAIAAGHVRATPMGRLGTAPEIADGVLYLCGPGAAFITGQVLGVNGGYL